MSRRRPERTGGLGLILLLLVAATAPAGGTEPGRLLRGRSRTPNRSAIISAPASRVICQERTVRVLIPEQSPAVIPSVLPGAPLFVAQGMVIPAAVPGVRLAHVEAARTRGPPAF